MIKELKKNPIDLTFSWSICFLTLFLGSWLILPFLQEAITIQEQFDIFLARRV